MHDLGDLLIRSGFAAPVMEMEYLTLTYAQLEDLLRDLRANGALSVRRNRVGLRTPRWRQRIAQRYEAMRRDGRLPATLEVIYGHAWKPDAERTHRAPGLTREGHAIVRFERPRRGAPRDPSGRA
jgi:malonyl-CoA O-methyltransferase